MFDCVYFVFRKSRNKYQVNEVKQPIRTSNRGRLNIPDESTLSRLVAARLDLPISQSLLDRNFKLSIIKRCWEDQLRLKRKYITYSDCIEKRIFINFYFR